MLTFIRKNIKILIAVSAAIGVFGTWYGDESLFMPAFDKVTTWADFYYFTFQCYFPIYFLLIKVNEGKDDHYWKIAAGFCMGKILDQFCPRPFEWHVGMVTWDIGVIAYHWYKYHKSANESYVK